MPRSSYATLLIPDSRYFGTSGSFVRLLVLSKHHYSSHLGPSFHCRTIPRHTTCSQLTRTASFFCYCIFTSIPSITTFGHLLYLVPLSMHFAFMTLHSSDMTLTIMNSTTPSRGLVMLAYCHWHLSLFLFASSQMYSSQ